MYRMVRVLYGHLWAISTMNNLNVCLYIVGAPHWRGEKLDLPEFFALLFNSNCLKG